MNVDISGGCTWLLDTILHILIEYYCVPFFSLADLLQASQYICDAVTEQMDVVNSSLSCKCLDSLHGVISCDKGTSAVLQWQYWAGDLQNGSYDPSLLPPVVEIQDLQKYENKKSEQKFVAGVCLDGFCDSHQRTAWKLEEQTACSNKSHRTGLLCGKCKDGFHLQGYYAQVSQVASLCVCLYALDQTLLTTEVVEYLVFHGLW